MQAQGEAWVSLPPKPPPIRRTSTVTAWKGMPSTSATSFWVSLGCWLEVWTTTPSSSVGVTRQAWPSR